MEQRKFTSRFRLVAGILLALVFVGGIYVGVHGREALAKITSLSAVESETADFTSFWKVWNIINEKYPNASGVSSQERVYGAIKGLVESLEDPYSEFFTPEETKDFQDLINGSFGGVGIEIGVKEKTLTAMSVLPNTPAEKAGILAGDKILKIDATATSDLSINGAVNLIKGEEGTTVTLTIYREGESVTREIALVRAKIIVPTLSTELRSDGIFVIEFYNFDSHAISEFKTAVLAFAKTGSKKLIIDLRGNPGGFLDAAIDTASWFLPAGEVIVRENFGPDEPETIYRSKGYATLQGKNIKIEILVDGGSASASEIFAGALSEHGVADLVGEQTYGKGSVQELIGITGETSLKLTIAKWLTPKGISISEQGLTPTYVVPFTDNDATLAIDPQLNKAIELLNQ